MFFSQTHTEQEFFDMSVSLPFTVILGSSIEKIYLSLIYNNLSSFLSEYNWIDVIYKYKQAQRCYLNKSAMLTIKEYLHM